MILLTPKTINIRIPPHLMPRFEALINRFGGLPPSTLVKFLISDLLERPLDEQIQIVNSQIQKPAQKTKSQPRAGMNSKSRIAGE